MMATFVSLRTIISVSIVRSSCMQHLALRKPKDIATMRGLVKRSIQLLPGSRSFATVTRLAEASRRGPEVTELILKASPASTLSPDDPSDLSCVNIMCEHVGEACICKLAKCLSRCPNITHLDLSGNNLGVLPEEGIASLEKLEYLDVSGNALTDLSVASKLSSLVTLKADDNLLSSLDLVQLENLTEVSLNRNNLALIPELSWSTICSPSFKIELDDNPCLTEDESEEED